MDLDVSNRVLNELASREAALDAQIEAAREEARRQIEAAEQEATRILRDAETQVATIQQEHDAKLKTETQQIRDDASRNAASEFDKTRQQTEGRLQQAAEFILKAVLP